MNSRLRPPVNGAEPENAGQIDLIHPSWRRYMGRGRPYGRPGAAASYFEAVVVIFNDWHDPDDIDIDVLAARLNWPRDDASAFVRELVADGVFDLPRPAAEEVAQ